YCAYDSFVRGLDTAGHLIWTHRARNRCSSPAITGNDRIVYGTSDGKFQILGSGGELIYEYDCGGVCLYSPAIGNDGIYIAGGRKVFKFAATGVALSEKNNTIQQGWPSLWPSLRRSRDLELEKGILFDVSGREIAFRGKSNLPPGIYFIIRTNGKQAHKIIIVAR
ncbi:MAG: T9SS type A sorting domain-containing protein, partial [candidate division WOR-3 bacterium]